MLMHIPVIRDITTVSEELAVSVFRAVRQVTWQNSFCVCCFRGHTAGTGKQTFRNWQSSLYPLDTPPAQTSQNISLKRTWKFDLLSVRLVEIKEVLGQTSSTWCRKAKVLHWLKKTFCMVLRRLCIPRSLHYTKAHPVLKRHCRASHFKQKHTKIQMRRTWIVVIIVRDFSLHYSGNQCLWKPIIIIIIIISCQAKLLMGVVLFSLHNSTYITKLRSGERLR